MGIEQYVGRTVDVLAYRGGTSTGERLLSQSLLDENDNGEIATGIQKLAQRFLLELLTEKGSIQYLPNRGCNFMYEARTGAWQTSLDVMAAFSAALLDIKENLQSEQSSSDPADEQFSDAELVSVSLTGDTASIVVRVVSAAGTSRVFVSPLQITV